MSDPRDTYENLGGEFHEHRYQGQTVRHGHAGGDKVHGYFDHPEDWYADGTSGHQGETSYVTPADVWGRDTVTYRRNSPPTLTRELVQVAVDEWWDHPRFPGKQRLVDVLCDHLGVTR